MRRIYLFTVLIIGYIVSACAQNESVEYGFSLPEGDAENGQVVFTEMRCIACHTLSSTDFVGQNDIGLDSVRVELGGEVVNGRIQTYADLVTSIINPSHRIAEGYPIDQITSNGKSKMLNYNDVLTVNELVDLVTFLKGHYELHSVPLTIYPYYYDGEE